MQKKAFVSDVQKYFDGKLFVHKAKILEGKFVKGEIYKLRINVARRKDIARHHTATHLLDSALIRVLGKHVRQAGSLVEDRRFRFDFTHFSKLTDKEIEKIEALVNSWIIEDYPVKVEIMDLEDAINSGAIALFDEKYEGKVRVVSVDGVSKELCGGTHCRSSGEIGLFKIVHESAVSKGVRRIEAKTGMWAWEYVLELEKIIKEGSSKLGVPYNELPKKIEELKSRKTENRKIKFDEQKIRVVDGFNLYVDILENEEISELRHLGDIAKNKMKSGIVLLFDKKKDRVNVIVMVTGDLTKRFKAKEIVLRISKALGGKGGGKEEFAQGGGRNIDKLNELVTNIDKYLTEV